jgi:uncharacterized protein YbjT (DUF2867 family)
MKIVVIGGSGLIGSRLVGLLRQGAHEVVAASPMTGVNTVTGDGLVEAMEQADVVVDVANSPSFEGKVAWDFFLASGNNLMATERAARVRHHVTLSVVGTDRMLDSGYFRAKLLQEDLVRSSGLPYTILRSTQFFEFIAGVVQDGSAGEVVISPARVQPISGLDVAEALADLATGEPLNGTVEVAGPERFRLPDLAAEVLTAYEDRRQIIADPRALYFGAELDDASLLPNSGARVAALRFEDWLRGSLQPSPQPQKIGAPA